MEPSKSLHFSLRSPFFIFPVTGGRKRWGAVQPAIFMSCGRAQAHESLRVLLSLRVFAACANFARVEDSRIGYSARQVPRRQLFRNFFGFLLRAFASLREIFRSWLRLCRAGVKCLFLFWCGFAALGSLRLTLFPSCPLRSDRSRAWPA